jgi:hypothetical protein
VDTTNFAYCLLVILEYVGRQTGGWMRMKQLRNDQ